MKALTSKEILDKVSDSSVFKGTADVKKLFLLAILAGAYIAIGGFASTMASYNLIADPGTFGLGKLVAGCVFPVGLMMVVLCGGELFTGNCMMVIGVADKKIKVANMLRNWVIVYLGNFVGAMIVVLFVTYSGQLDSSEGLLGAITVKMAVGKVNLDFGRAVVLGIMCNWLVCLAVWMATGAQATVSKIFAIFFIILPFIIGGFEHSVANMYFIPAGMIAATNDAYVQLLGLDISGLTIGAFIVKNLIPVTIGNIIGGGVFVGMFYWLIHRK
ncbi:MAG: formate/nitrite transporter family protein [Bacillota bacterium]|nr:formate/nitrite transporter family protein [Bacillota bacterium]